MTWFKMDDKLHDHRKTRQAGLAAMGLWAVAGSWAADNLTDGFVPEAVLPRWGGRDYDVFAHADALIAAGFWAKGDQDGEPGYLFNDWAEYQPTREEVESKRASARERMARVRANSTRTFEGTSREVRSTRPDPSRPDPTRPETHTPPTDKPSTRHAFDPFWDIYPRKVAKPTAKKAWEKAVKRVDPSVILDGAVRMACDPNLPESQFIPHPSTWLNRDGWNDEPFPPPAGAPMKASTTDSRVQVGLDLARRLAAAEQASTPLLAVEA